MRDQRGQLLPLALGLLVIVLAVVGVGVDLTRLFIARRSLQSVADAASLRAADSLDMVALYSSAGRSVRIDRTRARDAALLVIEQRGLEATASVDVDLQSVTIRLRSSVDTGLLQLIGVDTLPIAVTSTGMPVEGVPDQGIQAPASWGR